MKKTVTVIGLGYVGQPLFEVLRRSKKFKVLGLDLKQELIKKIAGQLRRQKEKFASVTTQAEQCLPHSDFIIVCVATPTTKKNQPDLSPLKQVSKTITKFLRPSQTIIIESTIYPGVCEEIVLPILEKSGLKGGLDFELSHCPERINPGDPRWQTANIPRNVGSLTRRGLKKTANFYRQFLKAKVYELNSLRETEATKLVENVFRDLNIAFANELAMVFDQAGIDLTQVMKAAGNKPFSFLPHYPGVGVGGECIATDPYYYLNWAKQLKIQPKLVARARAVNEAMPSYVINKLTTALRKSGKSLSTSKIAVLGLSYKPEVADTRQSPSLQVIKLLKQKHARFMTYDPLLSEQSTTKTLNQVLRWADTILLCTAHQVFIKQLTAKKLKTNKIKLVIDGRNCLDKISIEKTGIPYYGVGR